jgi:hypothetical protein
MKKTLLILGGIALFLFLLVVRLFFRQNSHMNDEREWFVNSLRYEFSAKVDSIWMLNESTGKLWCRLTDGDPHVDREDSLKRSFKEHDMLYLIFHKSADSIVFLVPYGNLVAKGDSVRVSSQDNSIKFFRNGSQVANDKLTNTLTGFGRPFFMKRNR